MTEDPKTYWLRSPHYFFATGCGSGLLKPAPGTWGTLVAVFPYYWLSKLSLPIYGLVLIAAFCYGCFICQKFTDQLGVTDHSSIVWDEIVGFWITMIAIPCSMVSVIVGFLIFRCLDIIKLWPIRWIDRSCKSGLGVMLDDVVAGIFANIILQFLRIWH